MGSCWGRTSGHRGFVPQEPLVWLPQLQHNPVPALGLLCAQGTSQFCSGSLGRCLLKIRPWLEPAAHWFPHPEFAVLWQKFPSHNHCFPCHGCHVRNYQTSEGKKKKPTDGKLDVASNCKVSLRVFWLEPGEFGFSFVSLRHGPVFHRAQESQMSWNNLICCSGRLYW